MGPVHEACYSRAKTSTFSSNAQAFFVPQCSEGRDRTHSCFMSTLAKASRRLAFSHSMQEGCLPRFERTSPAKLECAQRSTQSPRGPVAGVPYIRYRNEPPRGLRVWKRCGRVTGAESRDAEGCGQSAGRDLQSHNASTPLRSRVGLLPV